MKKFLVCCAFFLGLFLPVLTSIVINELSGTKAAQLGTNTTTIKCDFEYENETGVEVKWFFNHDVQIFTWIPGRTKPQAMGPFSGILDVDTNTIHFKEMRKNLTGSYTCKVSSDGNETVATETMIVYKPASMVEFFHEETSETLICSAYELYPQPNITIVANYVSRGNESLHVVEEDEDITDTEDNLYNVTKTFKLDRESLRGSARFVCNVTIPETDYQQSRIIIFEKSGNEHTTEYFNNHDSTTKENSLLPTSIYSTTQGFAVSTTVPSNFLLVTTVVAIIWSKR